MRAREPVDGGGQEGQCAHEEQREEGLSALAAAHVNQPECRGNHQRGKEDGSIQPHQAVGQGKEHLRQPLMGRERRAAHGMREHVLEGDGAGVEDVIADGDVTPQVAIAVDHLSALGQHPDEGAQPQDGAQRGQQIEQDRLRTVLHFFIPLCLILAANWI